MTILLNLESDNPTKITLKDLSRCLIRFEIEKRMYYDEKLEKRNSHQDNRALVAVLLGIYSTKYRNFEKRKKKENVKIDSGKKKHK